MSRLWEKGQPLAEQVLRYTAGEDHILDARLVEYDVRGSIAHADPASEWCLVAATLDAELKAVIPPLLLTSTLVPAAPFV